MARAVVVLLSLFFVAATSPTARSQTAAPAGYSVASRANLYDGVEYVKLTKTKAAPVVAHVAHVLPGARVDLRVVNANDRISTNPEELEPTSSMCGRVHCIIGVNGDFHVAGAPAGGVVADGRMLRSPDPGRPQLTVAGDGRLVAGPLPWTGSLTVADGQQVPVSTVNDAPRADGLALYTPEYGPSTDASSRTELVVRATDAVGSLNRPTDLEVTGLRPGAGPIPADGAVLSGEGAAAQQLRDLWARRKPGVPPRARLLVSSPVDASMSLGVEPVVLRDGRRATPWRDPNVINPRQPHTLVGWNEEGHTYLVAVDGRQAASEGVTMAEAADFLLGLGVTDAVSLDGGGGTTFVAGKKVWNRPSDNDPARPAQYAERGATNALVLMARPGAPLPPAEPPTPPPAPEPEATTPSAVTGDGMAGETDDPSPTPSVGGTLDTPFGPFNATAHLAVGDLPTAPSLAGPGRQGRPAAPVDQAAATEEGAAAPVDLAGTQSPVGADPSTATGDDPSGEVSLAALTSPAAKAAPGGHRSPTPFKHLRMGAIGGALLLTAATQQRRRRRHLGRLPRPAASTPARQARPARRPAPSTRPRRPKRLSLPRWSNPSSPDAATDPSRHPRPVPARSSQASRFEPSRQAGAKLVPQQATAKPTVKPSRSRARRRDEARPSLSAKRPPKPGAPSRQARRSEAPLLPSSPNPS